MKKTICPNCEGKGFISYYDAGSEYKKICSVCLGKGMIVPGEPYKRFKKKGDMDT